MVQACKPAFYPGRAPIDAYGNGGFRFAKMSHVGSLLCLPNGIYGWDVRSVEDIGRASLSNVFAGAGAVEVLLIGTGEGQVFLEPVLSDELRSAGLVVETMTTGAAARTYNVLLAEQRAVAAALIAVGEVPGYGVSG